MYRYSRDKRIKREVRANEESGTSGIETAPVIGVHGDETLPLSREQVEGHDDEIAQALQNRLNKSDEMDGQSIVSDVDSTPSVSSTGTPVPEAELALSRLTSQSPNPDSRGILMHGKL